MSDPKDHKHDHDHEHNHDHGHDHDHEHDDLLAKSRRKTPPTPPPQDAAPIEDAGSQALSEALSSSFAIVKVVMVVLVAVFLGSGIFTVPSQERAIKLRFGRPVGEGDQQFLGPGLHWSFPYPIDEIVRIPIGEIQTTVSTVGWYATTPEMEAAGAEPPFNLSLNPAIDGYTITSDGNIIHARATLRYRISNPANYALNFVNASNIVQNALNNALFHASAQFTADQALRSEKQAFQEKILARVRQLVEQQSFGISLEQVEVRTLPPRQVKESFEKVFASEVELRKVRKDAEGEAGRILSAAQGEAASITNAGATDRIRLVQAVEAESRYFKDQLPHYRENPELFKTRLQTEAFARAFTNVESKWFLPAPQGGKAPELRLQLSREPQKPAQQSEQK